MAMSEQEWQVLLAKKRHATGLNLSQIRPPDQAGSLNDPVPPLSSEPAPPDSIAPRARRAPW
jgi:hypothetical protein